MRVLALIEDRGLRSSLRNPRFQMSADSADRT